MQILTDFDLTPYNTFAVSCRAYAFCEVFDSSSLRRALDYASAESLPVLVLGGGSNVLFSDDYPGLVIRMGIPGIELIEEDGDQVQVRAGAGENWHQLVMHCLINGFYGLENMVLIPGTTGAAPIQNIGAYGVELSRFLVNLTALEVNSGELWTFDREACQFGYRDSVFKHCRPGELIITSVTLQLSRTAAPETGYQALQEELQRRQAGTEPDPLLVAQAVMAIRQSKLPDPALLPNCGSFFKNPVVDEATCQALEGRFGEVPVFPLPEQPGYVKVPAAWLLDRAGWKGQRRGAAGVHRNQAVVLVNYGGATGAELLALARDMQRSVAEEYGISLEPEVRII
ncbi:MAG: UDP-N-acetylmuramate dehydrogenase [Gammaproteobacteria bacterium]